MKFNKLVPELKVTNLKNSLDFYSCIGFKIEYQRDSFVFLSFQGSQIMLEKINTNWSTGKLVRPFGRGINFQIEVKKIRPLVEALKKNKYSIFQKLKDNWYKISGANDKNKFVGCREFLVQDPDGYLLRFSESLGIKKS